MSGSVNKVILYTQRNLSIPQIAAIVNESRSRVRQHLISSGVQLRSRADGLRLRAPDLGKHLIGLKRPMSEEAKRKLSVSKLKHGEATARGKSLKPSGYIEITRGPNRGKGEHVVIMERRLGRALLPDECVHHIDHNRANNDENNLALMTRSGHMRHHRREEHIIRKANHEQR